ncbi:CTP synthase [Camellia lanceoleosa]|uniref:CTP synthase n=1 Tax=Camellia lanceoleosa TaxID=1840588 RepID=A0ACC0IHW1_9ERIC|nr:CTP synthase [Camellia lanceoleosa]
MMLAAKYARENKVPYLGICLGMQISVIEYARSVLGWEKANSTEFDNKTPNPVVIFIPNVLALYYIFLSYSFARNTEYVDERHRHRYEVNPDMIDMLEEAGLKFVGKDESGKRMERMLGALIYVNGKYHLNPLTWPEILRQFALSAGFGPKLKKRSIEKAYLRDELRTSFGIIQQKHI